MPTRTKGGDGNLRRSTVSLPPWTWRKRRPIVAEVLKARHWSWMTVQECTPEQRQDLIAIFEERTGHRWKTSAIVNVGILWDDHKWKLEQAFHGKMRGGTRKRYTAMVVLRRRTTDELFIFCSAHLSHEQNYAKWRRRQARKMDDFLDRLKLTTGCERVIIGADLNSDSMAPKGPRGVLTDSGYRSLFDIFATNQIINGTADTFTGFPPTPPRHNSRRIDDVLSTGLTIHRAEIVETHHGSDHRFIEVGARS